MNVKKLLVLIIIMFAVCQGCDSMFEDWLDDPPGTGTGELQWMSLGMYNETLGMTTLSTEYTGAASPRLAVYNGALYALWVQDSTLINLYRYNGNDYSPSWIFEDSFPYSSLTGELAVCTAGGTMYIGFVNGTDLNVLNQDGNQIGINIDYNTGGNLGSLNLVAYDNNLFVVWEENEQVRMKKYDVFTTIWEAGVEDSYGYGINESPYKTVKGRAVECGGLVYVVFMEVDASLNHYVKMRCYDDASMYWYTCVDRMNYDSIAPGYPDYPSLVTYYGHPYAMWTETVGTGERRLNVSSWYLNRIDGSGVGGVRWDTTDLYSPIMDTNLVVSGGNLYALWIGNVNDYENGVIFNSFRAAVYDPFSFNVVRPWKNVDGNDYQGLNVNHGYYAMAPYGVEFNGKLYVIYLEDFNGYNYVHAKVAY